MSTVLPRVGKKLVEKIGAVPTDAQRVPGPLAAKSMLIRFNLY